MLNLKKEINANGVYVFGTNMAQTKKKYDKNAVVIKYADLKIFYIIGYNQIIHLG